MACAESTIPAGQQSLNRVISPSGEADSEFRKNSGRHLAKGLERGVGGPPVSPEAFIRGGGGNDFEEGPAQEIRHALDDVRAELKLETGRVAELLPFANPLAATSDYRRIVRH